MGACWIPVPTLQEDAGMTEPVTCEACIHFRRADINPEAGIGVCTLKHVGVYPLAPRYCRQRQVAKEDEDE